MKIAFVSGNTEQLPDPVIPLGLLCVAASCPPEHDRVLWDLCFDRAPTERLARELGAYQPDVVGLGIRNAQGNDYAGTEQAVARFAELVRTVRASSRALVVVGGGGFSLMPEAWMAALRADYGVRGEGEAAFGALLAALEEREPTRRDAALAAVPSLLWWEGAELRHNPPAARFLELDRLPRPDRRLVDERHYQRIGIESVQTKRGCALRCEYCTYPSIEGRQVRTRAPERVADEIDELRALHPGVHHLFVVDSVFTIPKPHAMAVCDALVRRGSTLPWTCYANPLGFDAELAAAMARAGCVGLEIGVDSGCDELLAALRKGFDTRAVVAMHELCRAAGLRACPTFMVGTPRESLDDVRRTLDFVDALDPSAAVVMLYTDPDEAMNEALRAEGEARRARVLELLAPYLAAHPRWIVPSTGLNFDARLFALLRRMGLRGPLWQHLDQADERWRRLSGIRAAASDGR
jgi:radical SAM superfamily enzyme YgiQ (UPF0313 family)